MPESNRKRLQPFEGAGRWISGGIGLGAALATILASAHSCGLLGDQSTRLSVASLAVSWIGLSPASDTAASLGDTRTIVTHPASTTHSKLTEEERRQVGIVPGLIRISVGLEHVDDVIGDIEDALAASR